MFIYLLSINLVLKKSDFFEEILDVMIHDFLNMPSSILAIRKTKYPPLKKTSHWASLSK